MQGEEKQALEVDLILVKPNLAQEKVLKAKARMKQLPITDVLGTLKMIIKAERGKQIKEAPKESPKVGVLLQID